MKTAKQGCPENLYDTLSSFSNTKGGIIIFGIDEKPRTKELGFDEKHPAYFINSYVKTLIEKGILKYTIPNKHKSKNQKIVIAED
ncbi:MAG: RNA-binding domain-containing protein [Bacilli bacterium]